MNRMKEKLQYFFNLSYRKQYIINSSYYNYFHSKLYNSLINNKSLK